MEEGPSYIRNWVTISIQRVNGYKDDTAEIFGRIYLCIKHSSAAPAMEAVAIVRFVAIELSIYQL